MAGELTTSPYPSGGGYVCSKCNAWVPDGTAHAICNLRVVNQIHVWPCFGTVHEFAVGPTHAICNRCSKVVKLDA